MMYPLAVVKKVVYKLCHRLDGVAKAVAPITVLLVYEVASRDPLRSYYFTMDWETYRLPHFLDWIWVGKEWYRVLCVDKMVGGNQKIAATKYAAIVRLNYRAADLRVHPDLFADYLEQRKRELFADGWKYMRDEHFLRDEGKGA